MTSVPQDVPLKQCNKCEQFKPATFEFFHAEKRGKNGLRATCRECRKASQRRPPKPPEVERVCKVCELPKPIAEFIAVTKKTRSGTSTERMCHECRNADRRRYRKDNIEWVIANERKRYSQHKDISNRQRRMRYQQNPLVRLQHSEYNKRWREQNHERVRLNMQRWRREHPEWRREWDTKNIERVREHSRRSYHRLSVETRLEQRRRYRKNNMTAVLARNHNRRARKKGAVGVHTAQDVQTQHHRQKGKCYWCHCKLVKYHIDHIVPLTRGGTNWPDNIVLACPTCNVTRGNKLPHEWVVGGRLL